MKSLTSFFARRTPLSRSSDLDGDDDDDDDAVVFVKVSDASHSQQSPNHKLSPPPTNKRQRSSPRYESQSSKVSSTSSSPNNAGPTNEGNNACPSNNWGALVDTRKRALWASYSNDQIGDDVRREENQKPAKIWVGQTIHRVSHNRTAPFTVSFTPSFTSSFRAPGSGNFRFDKIRGGNEQNFAESVVPSSATRASSASSVPSHTTQHDNVSTKKHSDIVRASNLRYILQTLKEAGSDSACWCSVAPDQRSRSALQTMINWCASSSSSSSASVSLAEEQTRDEALDMLAIAFYHKEWWHHQLAVRDNNNDVNADAVNELLSPAAIKVLLDFALIATSPRERETGSQGRRDPLKGLLDEPLDDWVAFLSRFKVDELKIVTQEIIKDVKKKDAKGLVFVTPFTAQRKRSVCRCMSDPSDRDQTKSSLIAQLLGVCNCSVLKGRICALDIERHGTLTRALRSVSRYFRLERHVYAMLLRAHTWVLGGSGYAPDEATLALQAGLRSIKFVSQLSEKTTTVSSWGDADELILDELLAPTTVATREDVDTNHFADVHADTAVAGASELDAFGVYVTAVNSFHALSDAIRCGRANRVYHILHETCTTLQDAMQMWGQQQQQQQQQQQAGVVVSSVSVPCSRCSIGHSRTKLEHVQHGLTWWWRHLALDWLCLTCLYGCHVLEREKRYDTAQHYLECCSRATQWSSVHQVFPLGGSGACEGCARAVMSQETNKTTSAKRAIGRTNEDLKRLLIGRRSSDTVMVDSTRSAQSVLYAHNDNPLRRMHLEITLRLCRDHSHLGNKDTSLRCIEAALEQQHVCHKLPKVSKRQQKQQQQQNQLHNKQSSPVQQHVHQRSAYGQTQNRVGGIGASLVRACLSLSVPPRRWVVRDARPLIESRVVRIKGKRHQPFAAAPSFNLAVNNNNNNKNKNGMRKRKVSSSVLAGPLDGQGVTLSTMNSTWSQPRDGTVDATDNDGDGQVAPFTPRTSQGVEQFVLDDFISKGWVGMHCENGLMATLFMLLFADVFWDVDISAEQQESRQSGRGVVGIDNKQFEETRKINERRNATPFLDAPRELLASVWYRIHVDGCQAHCSRNERTRKRLAEISSGCLHEQQQQQGGTISSRLTAGSAQGVCALLGRNWNRFYGTQLRGVNWCRNSLDELERIVECLFITQQSTAPTNSSSSSSSSRGVGIQDGGVAPGAVLAVMAEAMLDDYKGWAGGMADLFLWRPRGSVWPAQHLFAEVKGPGDSLSDRQRAWIDKLVTAGASVEVVYVDKVE